MKTQGKIKITKIRKALGIWMQNWDYRYRDRTEDDKEKKFQRTLQSEDWSDNIVNRTLTLNVVHVA